MSPVVTEVYILSESTNYHGYDLPEECFLNYDNALARLKELSKRLKLRIRSGNYIQLHNGTIEIHSIKVSDL